MGTRFLLERDGDGRVGQVTREVGGVQQLAGLNGGSLTLAKDLEDAVDQVSLSLRGAARAAGSRRAASALAVAVAVLTIAALAVTAVLAVTGLLAISTLLAVATLLTLALLALVDELESVTVEAGTSNDAGGSLSALAVAVAALLAVAGLLAVAAVLALHNTAEEIPKNTLDFADLRRRDGGRSTALASGEGDRGGGNTRDGNAANTGARKNAVKAGDRDTNLTGGDGHSGSGSSQATQSAQGGASDRRKARDGDTGLAVLEDDGRGSDSSTGQVEGASGAARDDDNVLRVALDVDTARSRGRNGAENATELVANVLASSQVASGSGLSLTGVVLMNRLVGRLECWRS